MTLRWRSWWDGLDRSPMPWAIAVIAALEYGGQAYQVAWQSRDALFGAPGLVGRLLGGLPGATWVLWGIIMVGLVGVVRDRRPFVSALVSLVAAGVLMRWQQEVFSSPARNSFVPGAALLAWVAGQAWVVELARSSGRPAPDRQARQRAGEAGVLGVIAAIYVGSAISKLSAAGLGWADGQQVRALILWQDSPFPGAFTDMLRDRVVQSGAMSRALSVATLVVEGGAFLLLARPSIRLLWSVLILGLHVGIIVLCGMLYVGPMVLLSVFAVPWPRIAGRAPPASERTDHEAVALRDVFPRRVLIAVVVFLLLAALLSPLGWRPPPA
jgi:hypothetical protein